MYSSLTKERDQLQASHIYLTTERDQLKTSFKNLTTERDNLQRKLSKLGGPLILTENTVTLL